MWGFVKSLKGLSWAYLGLSTGYVRHIVRAYVFVKGCCCGLYAGLFVHVVKLSHRCLWLRASEGCGGQGVGASL